MENTYYLAIETKPKSYFPINLAELNLNFNSTKLEEIDNFTLKYTNLELINIIKEKNLLDINAKMPLVIIYKEKKVIREIPVLTKDLTFDMWKYLKDNYEDKNFLNKIYNFLSNKTNINLIKIKNSSNLNEFLKTISDLPYILQRKLYFYLNEK